MNKQTKEIITKQYIKGELKRLNTGRMIISAILALACFPFGVGFTSKSFSTLVQEIARDDRTVQSDTLLSMLASAAVLAAGVYFLMKMIYIIYSIRSVEKDGFTVVDDILLDMQVEYTGRGRGMTPSRIEIFRFAKMGRYVLSERARSAFDYSSVGDEFFLVMLDNKMERPKFVFNKKIYEYRE